MLRMSNIASRGGVSYYDGRITLLFRYPISKEDGTMRRRLAKWMGLPVVAVVAGLLVTACEKEQEEEQAQEIPADISGVWAGGSTAPNGDTEGLTVTIAQNGNNISGTLALEHSGSFTVSGTYASGEFNGSIPGSTMHLTFRGNSASGTSTITESGETYTINVTKQ